MGTVFVPKRNLARILFRYHEALFYAGSRTGNRDTFFCVAKRKYPKKRPPHAA
jgi:hypothetical protein